MATPEGIIDLGELPPHGHPDGGGDLAGHRRLRESARGWLRQLGPDRLRAVATAVVALLTLATVTAAAPLPDRPVSLGFEITSGDLIALDGQRAYTVESVARDRAEGLLTAYDLASGAVVWQLQRDDLGNVTLFRDGDFLFLQDFGGESFTQAAPDFRVTRLDPATGESIWSLPGSPVFPVSPDGPLLVQRPMPTFSLVPDWAPVHRQEYTAVEPDTGQPLWRLEATPLGSQLDPVAGRLLVLDLSGELTGYDLATGAQVGTATAVEPVSSTETWPQLTMHSTTGVVTVAQLADAGWLLRAYDTADLRPRWSRRLPHDPGGAAGLILRPCGLLICHDHHSGGWELVLDPATGGDVHWSDSVWELAATPAYHVPAHPDLAGYLLLADQTTATGRLIDAATGQPVLDLAGWQLPYEVAESAPPLLLKPPGRQPFGPPGEPRYLVGVVRNNPLRVEPLGAIDPGYSDCQLYGSFVLCHPTGRDSGGPTIWPVRW